MFKKADIPLTNVVPSGAQRVQAVLLSPSIKPLGSPCTPCPITTTKKHTNIVPAETIPRMVVWRRSRMRLPAHMTALEEEEGVVRNTLFLGAAETSANSQEDDSPNGRAGGVTESVDGSRTGVAVKTHDESERLWKESGEGAR